MPSEPSPARQRNFYKPAYIFWSWTCFHPSRRDPQGIHKVIWDRILDEPFELPPDKPLTVVAYRADAETVAYVEPVAVGDSLPDMPLFLAPDRYVPCPLEATYQTAWAQFPEPLKGPLESPPGP